MKATRSVLGSSGHISTADAGQQLTEHAESTKKRLHLAQSRSLPTNFNNESSNTLPVLYSPGIPPKMANSNVPKVSRLSSTLRIATSNTVLRQNEGMLLTPEIEVLIRDILAKRERILDIEEHNAQLERAIADLRLELARPLSKITADAYAACSEFAAMLNCI